MVRRGRTLAVAVITAAAAVTTVGAATPINIRLSTFAPTNSAWHRLLLDMGAVWAKKTDGRVILRVNAGGEDGTEPSVVQQMRTGSREAALLLLPGLAEIDPSCNVMGMPFFLQNDAEMKAVLAAVTPELSRRLEAKHFHVLFWGTAGWVQLFSKMPIKSLADLRSAKLYTTDGDDKMVAWYKAHGFNPKPLDFNSIPGQLELSNGMIDAVPSPPLGAKLLGFFRKAPYMLDLRIAPLIGAAVITEKAWNAISPADRDAMLVAATAVETKIMADAPGIDADAIQQMASRDLKVTRLDPKAAAEFRAEADKLVASMKGDMVPEDIYMKALAARDAVRK